MARKSVETAINEAVVVDTTAAHSVDAANEVKVAVEPLKDTDEIEVVSLIPNVFYKDKHTEDFFEWHNVGHVELMSYEMIKRMHRECRYFKTMALKPNDQRVIDKLGLKSVYAQFDYLFDAKSYNRSTMKKICADISKLTTDMKHRLCDKLKDMISSGDMRDIAVIRAVEKHLDIDLISSIQ